MKAAIYARYSSDKQRSVSIEQQLEVCRSFAERNGYEIVKVYEDRALTGTSDKRPGFQQMIQESRTSEWEYLIVYQLDRFARDRYDSAIYKRKLKDNGVRVLSAMENITDDPTGVLIESVLEGLAEYYSKELSTKIRRGLRYNAQNGLVTNGAIPYGYDIGEGLKYEINPVKAEIVRELFRRRADGEAVADICRDWNRRGLRNQKGNEWKTSQMYHMLQNERYLGIYIYSDIRIEDAFEPIVDAETWDKVNHKVQDLKHKGKFRPGRPTYQLSGKLYCGECGEHMVGISAIGASGGEYFYYACNGKHLHSGCRKKNVKKEEIEEAVCGVLRDVVLTDETIAQIVSDTMAARKPDDRQVLEQRLKTVNEEIEKTTEAVLKGFYTDSLRDKANSLQDEKNAILAVLEEKKKALPEVTPEELTAFLKSFRDGDIYDPIYRQALFDAFLERVYIYDNGTFKAYFTTDRDVPHESSYDYKSVPPKAYILTLLAECFYTVTGKTATR